MYRRLTEQGYPLFGTIMVAIFPGRGNDVQASSEEYVFKGGSQPLCVGVIWYQAMLSSSQEHRCKMFSLCVADDGERVG